MTENILATYRRTSSLPHYCRSYFAKSTEVIEVTCKVLDFSEEREMGITVNGVLCPDLYQIAFTPVKGPGWVSSFHTSDEANRAFKAWKRRLPDLAKV